MTLMPPREPIAAPQPVLRSAIGRVIAVSGAQVTVGLSLTATPEGIRSTVGRFLSVQTSSASTVGLITEITEATAAHPAYRSIARLDLMGEIRVGASGAPTFQRGVTDYPTIGDAASMLSERDLRLIYVGGNGELTRIGSLQQDPRLGAHIDIDHLISKHFAVLGSTGVGKSNGVAIILQRILEARPNLRVFLIDPHNEYGRCFGDRAQVLTPRNLRLPFWLFNFEETVDAFFGGRPGVEEEVAILAEVIPLAKAAYGQYRAGERPMATKRKEPRSTSFAADTPVPYRIEDLITLIDERMGKLENRSSRAVYNKLIQRIQTFRTHPRYGFMFENANIGGDTMAEVVSHLFRLPPNGKPMTIMQMAGFPAEVVDSVVSVVSRMAFDFGLWSDGAMPLLFVCEEAHRYAPADSKIGFGPTRRALSRIAKEGRKYGVFLGLITQRPADIDPTILSQCSTLFVMRLANERDQALIRAAVSDAAGNLLSFIPSLGTGEVFAFGAGVSVPTRLRFTEVPPHLRPTSEAGVTTSASTGGAMSHDLVASVIERWRASTMSQKVTSFDDESEWSPPPSPALRDEAPLAPTQAMPGPAPTYGGYESPRSSLLRKPLSALDGPPAAAPAPRWR